MSCEHFEWLIGMRCNLIGDSLNVITPFTFSGGDAISVFAQFPGDQVHFFDDGFTLFSLRKIGINLADRKRWRPLHTIAETHGITLSHNGVFEILCPQSTAAGGFARLVSTLLGVVSWSKDQVGVDQDADWLVEEVSMYLQAWRPGEKIVRSPPPVKSASGKILNFDLLMGNQFIDAIGPHGQSSNAEIRKFLELSTVDPARDLMVVVDDRTNPEAAKQEIAAIGHIGTAWPLTRLIEASGSSRVTL